MDIYFRRDIANVLRALANVDRAAEEEEGEVTVVSQAYHRAVRATLASVGYAFGLGPMVSQDRKDGSVWIEVEKGGTD